MIPSLFQQPAKPYAATKTAAGAAWVLAWKEQLWLLLPVSTAAVESPNSQSMLGIMGGLSHAQNNQKTRHSRRILTGGHCLSTSCKAEHFRPVHSIAILAALKIGLCGQHSRYGADRQAGRSRGGRCARGAGAHRAAPAPRWGRRAVGETPPRPARASWALAPWPPPCCLLLLLPGLCDTGP